MENCEIVTQQFLSPAANLVDGHVIINEFMQSNAIGYPVKVGAPDILLELSDGPAAACCLANKGMEMAVLGGTSA